MHCVLGPLDPAFLGRLKEHDIQVQQHTVQCVTDVLGPGRANELIVLDQDTANLEMHDRGHSLDDNWHEDHALGLQVVFGGILEGK